MASHPPGRAAKPASGAGVTFRWTASFYDERAGSPTASGEPFDPAGLTAAHRTLAFGTLLRVTSPATGRTVVVRINDRGPFVAGRELDLSAAAARAIWPDAQGVGAVLVQVLRRP
jgi:rare lipoprotein A